MTIYAAPGGDLEASLLTAMPGGSGLVGTIRVSIVDTPAGATFLAPTTSNIVENPPSSGLYHWSGSAPGGPGRYSIIWDRGSSSELIAVEELVLSGTTAPDVPPSGGGGFGSGRFALSNRFFFERCQVTRYEQIGTEDGTPIQGLSIADSGVPCRVDPYRGRTDMMMRGKFEATSREHALCYLPSNVDLRAGDRLGLTQGPRLGLIYEVLSSELIDGAFAGHHVEAEIGLVTSAF
jgi:hypothetical protein